MIRKKRMVRAVGLEPTLQRNWILNPARLPIPPRPQGMVAIYNADTPKTTEKLLY
tara:strand:+ start:43240 stop:43404 length:165 start_codon:yes stop_codon:yes gene_type:complete